MKVKIGRSHASIVGFCFHSYLRQLFRNLFHKQGFTYDYVFDWNMLKFGGPRQDSASAGGAAAAIAGVPDSGGGAVGGGVDPKDRSKHGNSSRHQSRSGVASNLPISVGGGGGMVPGIAPVAAAAIPALPMELGQPPPGTDAFGLQPVVRKKSHAAFSNYVLNPIVLLQNNRRGSKETGTPNSTRHMKK